MAKIIEFGFMPNKSIEDSEFLITTKDGRIIGCIHIDENDNPLGILRLSGEPLKGKFCNHFWQLCNPDNGSGKTCLIHFGTF